MISVPNGSHHVQSTLFMVNKDEWDTKEGHGKSMKNVLQVITSMQLFSTIGVLSNVDLQEMTSTL